jgi:hypothetical protein
MDINKKIGHYIRVSSEKQLKDGFSFEDHEVDYDENEPVAQKYFINIG